MPAMEKRNAYRVTVARPVLVETEEGESWGQVGNLSLSGCLVAGVSLPIGAVVRLKLELDDGEPPLTVRAAVVRETRWDGQPALGLKFVPETLIPKKEERLSRFVRRVERRELAARRTREEGEV
jgi:hypothetical protein